MKGQYRILLEVMLVLIGIFITGFVIGSFGTVEASVTDVSVEDGLSSVANSIVIGVLKVSLTNNSLIRIDIPDKIANDVYKIKLDGDLNEVSVESTKDSLLLVKRKIFNIALNRIISTTEVVSSGGVVEIVNDADGIKIRRPPPST